MTLVVSLLMLALGALFAFGSVVMICLLPVGLVLHVLKVPAEREALGGAILTAPLATAMFSWMIASVNIGDAFGVVPVGLGVLAGVVVFVSVHVQTPPSKRLTLAPVAKRWRETKAENERIHRDEEARRAAEAARKAAPPTIQVGQYATKRWWVRVSGGRFGGERKFESEAAALAFVERVKKKTGCRVGSG